MPGGGGARILRTLVAGRGQDVRVGCRGAHVRLVPKREGYISLFCLDAHPTPSPASSAHLEDARLDAHLRILVGFPPPLGLDAGWHGCRRSCGRRRPRSPGLNVRPTCNNDVTGQSGPPPMRRFGRSFTASAPVGCSRREVFQTTPANSASRTNTFRRRLVQQGLLGLSTSLVH